MNRLLASLAVAAIVAAPSIMEPAPAAAAGSGSVTRRAPDAQPFVSKAAAGDMFEVQSSRLALQRSRDPAVRAFAQMMVDDHTRMSEQLRQAVQHGSRARIPPKLDDAHAQQLKRLKAAQAAEFDRQYIAMQIAGHEAAVALHSAYARDGGDPALKALAADAEPVVRGHLDRLKTITPSS